MGAPTRGLAAGSPRRCRRSPGQVKQDAVAQVGLGSPGPERRRPQRRERGLGLLRAAGGASGQGPRVSAPTPTSVARGKL